MPARRSILTGRRVFPFRGWHPYRGLLAEPGWAPIADVRTTFTSALAPLRLLDRVRHGQHLARLLAAVGAVPAQLRPLRQARWPDRRHARTGVSEQRAAPLAADARWRTPTRATGSAATSPTAATRTTRRARSPRACSATPRACWRPRAGRAVRARRRHLRATRAVDAAAPLHRHVRRPRLPRPRAGAALLRAGQPLPARAQGGGAARPHARPVRGRGDDDRPLAGRVPRPLPRARPGARHGRGARVRPRLLPGRLRLHRQDRDGPAPASDPRAADRDRPAPAARRAHEQLPRVDARRGPDDPVDGGRGRAARHGRRGPVALLRGPPPAQAALRVRRLRQQLLRAHRPTGRCTGPTRGGDFHLYDRGRDPGEGRDVSGAHAGKARELYGVVRRRAGSLPTFPY